MNHSAMSAAAASRARTSQSSPPCCSGVIEALLSWGLEDPPRPEFGWPPPRLALVDLPAECGALANAPDDVFPVGPN
jgi:hypothetical protein